MGVRQSHPLLEEVDAPVVASALAGLLLRLAGLA